MKIRTLALFLCLVAPSFAQPPAADAEANAAITQLRQGLIDSFFKGDIDRALTYLAPDVVVTWQNGEVSRGPAEVKAYYERVMTGPNRVVREIHAKPEVEGRNVLGATAVSWGNLHDEFVLADGKALPFNSRFTIVTTKRGDRWLVVGYHASINAFDNPVLNMAAQKGFIWGAVGGVVVGLLAGFILFRQLRRPAA